MLTVRHPETRVEERRYIASELLGSRLGLPLRFQVHGRPDTVIDLGESRTIVIADGFLGLPDAEWLKPASIPGVPLPLRGSERLGNDDRLRDGVHVLPTRDGSSSSGEINFPDDRTIVIDADLLGSAFFFLSRYEEVASNHPRDRFDRFPASASYACRHDLLKCPVVDQYVAVLHAVLRQLAPTIALREPLFKIEVSHDVDLPLKHAWSNCIRMAGGGLRDFVHTRSVADFQRRVSEWYAVRHQKRHDRDPYNTFGKLMDSSAKRGLRSAFYFIAERSAGNLDALYEIDDPFIEDLIGRIHSDGHEVGLHASFTSYLDPQRTAREFTRLAQVCDRRNVRQGRWGGRQHYLRWRAPETFRNWEAAGLDYDSTLGFADQAGFRCGTCHEFQPFDLVERRKMKLVERPLILMDTTLMNSMRLGTGDKALTAGLQLKRQCALYAGTFALLWHNSNLVSESQWRLYLGLLDA